MESVIQEHLGIGLGIQPVLGKSLSLFVFSSPSPLPQFYRLLAIKASDNLLFPEVLSASSSYTPQERETGLDFFFLIHFVIIWRLHKIAMGYGQRLVKD